MADLNIPAVELPPLLTTEEAAEFLRLQPQTLALWRSTGGRGLPFVRVGRAIRYRREHLLAWIQRNETGTAGVEVGHA